MGAGGGGSRQQVCRACFSRDTWGRLAPVRRPGCVWPAWPSGEGPAVTGIGDPAPGPRAAAFAWRPWTSLGALISSPIRWSFQGSFPVQRAYNHATLEGWDGVEGGKEVQEGGNIPRAIYVDRWQKPTQYCKSIMLQLKKNFFLRKPPWGTSLTVQWLGHGAFTARAWIWPLAAELRYCKPSGQPPRKKKTCTGWDVIQKWLKLFLKTPQCQVLVKTWTKWGVHTVMIEV